MEASIEVIKELREQTNCGVMDCKKALKEANGDINKAKDLLRQRGLEMAAKKGDRLTKEGRVESYIHLGSKIGVIVEVNCETDFVAKNEEFCKFAKDVAMHIAACSPKYVSKAHIPEDVLKQQADQQSYIKETCLLDQPFVRDASKTIQDCINLLVAQIGENILISRFIRYKVGESE